nr:glutathione S-transferase alpha-5-like isoform X1 [Ciona intestinalis]|eukprot:XP_002120526.1 glutathione S-transferase alpha-5-like isoform X1 [Ciona intestinalis]
MSKPILYYTDGRGRAEKIRWMLAACGIDYNESFISNKVDFQRQQAEGLYLFKEIPMLEIDGMRIVQTVSILRYLARKGNFMGETEKEQVLVDMYSVGMVEMTIPGLYFPFKPNDQKPQIWLGIKKELKNKFLNAFENILQTTNNGHLVGNKQTMADVLLFESIIYFMDIEKEIINEYPKLQAFMASMKEIPWVQKFLQPGSKRKDFADEKYVAMVTDIFFS